MTEKDLVRILNQLFPSSRWPKPFNLLQGRLLIAEGETLKVAARQVGTTAAHLGKFSGSAQSLPALLGDIRPEDTDRRGVRQILGNLIVGKCAETSFEEIYKEHTHTTELELRDLREGRSDTDYRLFNGRGRPVYRINIKYHGSLFRRAREMVDLDPEDCFALATYKIHGALQKQTSDQLPYIFVVVSVPDLTAESIGSGVPSDLQDFIAHVSVSDRVPGKRVFEDKLVDYLQAQNHQSFSSPRKRIAEARWYVLSARRADMLLREKLFDRVYALRTRNFARAFRGAELDMHFSLSKDMTPLASYLETLRTDGYPKVTTLLERGVY